MRTQCSVTPFGNSVTMRSQTYNASASPVATHVLAANDAMSLLIWRPSKRATISCCSSVLSAGEFGRLRKPMRRREFHDARQIGRRHSLEYLDGCGLEREDDSSAGSQS